MPRLTENNNFSLQRFTHGASGRLRNAWDNFWDFAMRDNVLEVAIGLIIASAFTRVVNSFVSDLMLPIISLLPFLNRNMDEKFAILRKGPNFHKEYGYNTLEQARDDGALVMAYGAFLDSLVSFLGVGLALYSIGQLYTWMSHDVVIKRTVKCKYCRKWISSKAMRCVNCTSWQDGREDHLPTR